MSSNLSSSQRRPALAGTRLILGISVLVGCAAFIYGFLVAQYEIFPYSHIRQVYRSFVPGSDKVPVTQKRTLHLVLNQRVVSHDELVISRGGGIARYNNTVVGVDAGGNFFYYKDGQIHPLDIEPDSNREAAFDYIDRHIDEEFRGIARETFRVSDLEIRQTGKSAEFYILHHYWDAQQLAKITRVSRLAVQNPSRLLDRSASYSADDWQVVFECRPVIEISNKYPSPFISNHSGGRLAVGPDNGIYVSFGDAKFDGIASPFVAPQEDGTCFGKIFRIDVDSLESSEVARGLRNPQGLMFDAQSQLWSTEHGPEGGDELNLIKAGNNYGWPYNTHGTSYDGRREWPMSIEPGRHADFPPPIYSWLPSVGASAILQVGDRPAVWAGDFLMGSLKSGSLHRMRVLNGRVVFEERIVIGERIRDLVQLDDGRLILWTDTPHILDLEPTIKSAGLAPPLPLSDQEKAGGLDAVLSSCSACHALGPDEISPVAPSLWRVHGRAIAATDYPGYSSALRNRSEVWDDDSLAAFLADPQDFAKGTTMRAVPMSDPTRQQLIDYLKRLD
jgi:cytochrome c2